MVHFKLETEILGLHCAFDADEELQFTYEVPVPIDVSLKQRDPGKVGIAICTARNAREIEPALKAEIAGCIKGGHVRWSEFKPSALKFVDGIFTTLQNITKSTITLFNWTHGLDSPPNPFGRADASYSEDGEEWFQYSQIRSIKILHGEITTTMYAKNIRVDEIVGQVNSGIEEPIGRQLFREAWSQVGINPRSALVIGVTAAEVGLKRLIGALVPAADWLVREIQAPPVRKILRDFVPTLPTKARLADGRPISVPPELIRQVEKAFERRNKVVHVGALPPSSPLLKSLLRPRPGR